MASESSLSLGGIFEKQISVALLHCPVKCSWYFIYMVIRFDEIAAKQRFNKAYANFISAFKSPKAANEILPWASQMMKRYLWCISRISHHFSPHSCEIRANSIPRRVIQILLEFDFSVGLDFFFFFWSKWQWHKWHNAKARITSTDTGIGSAQEQYSQIGQFFSQY